jgi:hypothetical protein
VTQTATFGLDIAKQVFQVHGADKAGLTCPRKTEPAKTGVLS